MKQGFKIIIFLVAISYSLIAQNRHFGVALNPSISKMKFINGSSLEQKWVYSSNIGIFYYRELGHHSSIGFEVLFLRMEGKLTSDEPLFPFQIDYDFYPPPGKYYSELKVHSNYAAVPIFYKCKWGHLAAKIGVQTMALCLSYREGFTKKEVNDVKSLAAYENNDMTRFRMDLGPKIGIEYSLGSNLALRCEYYQGLAFQNSVYFESNISNRQATLGLQYSLTKSNIKS